MLSNSTLLITKDGEITKTTKKKQKVILLAKKVQQQADKYRLQLKKCQKKLNRNKYIIF